ncbi:PTPLA-domain-containing protein [Wilcoxina mikolae CBS 423.85]|nr:PTPLA-domain-containing protein [Wilcoxina mikolae CBS 423.85]
MAERQPSASLTTRYLITYNTLSTLLWSFLLIRTLLLLPLVGPTNLYPSLGSPTKWIQSLAVLEILHLLLGLLRSSLPTTIIQVSSRLLLVWGICDIFSAPQQSNAYASMVFAWAVTEVCRYSYYIVQLGGGESKTLSWLRYNTFFVLYPLGAGSEAWCIYRALPEAWRLSRGYYWFLVVILVTYLPGLFNQYTHMMRQRRKNMRGKKKAQVVG